MGNLNVLLFDPEKAHICIVRDIGDRDTGHQPGKKCQYQQEGRISYIGRADDLFYF